MTATVPPGLACPGIRGQPCHGCWARWPRAGGMQRPRGGRPDKPGAGGARARAPGARGSRDGAATGSWDGDGDGDVPAAGSELSLCPEPLGHGSVPLSCISWGCPCPVPHLWSLSSVLELWARPCPSVLHLLGCPSVLNLWARLCPSASHLLALSLSFCPAHLTTVLSLCPSPLGTALSLCPAPFGSIPVPLSCTSGHTLTPASPRPCRPPPAAGPACGCHPDVARLPRCDGLPEAGPPFPRAGPGAAPGAISSSRVYLFKVCTLQPGTRPAPGVPLPARGSRLPKVPGGHRRAGKAE